MTTSDGSPAHTHDFTADIEGNGETTSTSAGKPHVHAIVRWDVKEANDHVHKIRPSSRR